MLAGCPWLQVEGVRHVSPREHEWPEQGSPGPAGGGVAGPPEPCQRPTEECWHSPDDLRGAPPREVGAHARGRGRESSRRTPRPRPPEAWPWRWGPGAAAAPGWCCAQGTAWRSSFSGGGKGRLATAHRAGTAGGGAVPRETGGLARDKCRLRCARTLTARDSHSSPTGPLPALLNLVNCAWYCTVARKPSSPTSVMRFPGGRGRQPTHHLL